MSSEDGGEGALHAVDRVAGKMKNLMNTLRANKDDPTSSEIDEKDIKKISKLGEGCFGVVWKGECYSLPVAIKYPHVQQLGKEELEDFRKEVHIMATNPHPHIVQFMGACTIPGRFAIVMELLDGNLENLLLSEEGPKMRLFQRLMMAKEAALGMNRLHKTEPAIIHRDFKLENLMYKKTDQTYITKVADFGLAAIKPKAKKTIRADPRGTPLTRAPEIMLGKPFNQKADVYSFGMTLWEIVTCKELFPHHSDYDEFMEAICAKGERPPIPSNCLPSLRRLLENLWDADPDKRPNFDEINLRLDEILVEAAISDPKACEFWKKNFLRDRRVEWEQFEEMFYFFIDKEPPLDPKGPTSDPNVLNLRCLQALLARKDPSNEGLGYVAIQHFGDVVAWFGGMRDINGTTMLDRMHTTLKHDWFHGDVTSEEASRRLRKEPGTYLVRFSQSDVGGYAITRINEKGKTVSIRISQDSNGSFSVNKDATYPTLKALIDSLKETLFLKEACKGSRFQAILQGEDDFTGYELVLGTEDESPRKAKTSSRT